VEDGEVAGVAHFGVQVVAGVRAADHRGGHPPRHRHLYLQGFNCWGGGAYPRAPSPISPGFQLLGRGGHTPRHRHLYLQGFNFWGGTHPRAPPPISPRFQLLGGGGGGEHPRHSARTETYRRFYNQALWNIARCLSSFQIKAFNQTPWFPFLADYIQFEIFCEVLCIFGWSFPRSLVRVFNHKMS
jgi:hypothetical protein